VVEGVWRLSPLGDRVIQLDFFLVETDSSAEAMLINDPLFVGREKINYRRRITKNIICRSLGLPLGLFALSNWDKQGASKTQCHHGAVRFGRRCGGSSAAEWKAAGPSATSPRLRSLSCLVLNHLNSIPTYTNNQRPKSTSNEALHRNPLTHNEIRFAQPHRSHSTRRCQSS
jgi:hypothetical protein